MASRRQFPRLRPTTSDDSSSQPGRSTFTERSSRLVTNGDDECEIAEYSAPTLANLPIPSQMTTEAIENEIRAARQVISDSTTQRNVVLDFLLHLQTAQRELANEAELVTRQLPSLRVRLSESASRNSAQVQTAASDDDQNVSSGVNPLQISVLSRLTRLSQRTREVMEDLDRRRNAVGMASLNHLGESASKDSSETEPSEPSDPAQLLRPMRKVRLEERLLVEWSPHELTLRDARIPTHFQSRQVFSRTDNRELISR